MNDPAEYREIVDALYRHGIALCGSFVFGLEEDDPRSLKKRSFVTGVKEEGRLIHDRWWLLERQEEVAPRYISKKMSGEALRNCWKRPGGISIPFPP